MRPIIRLARFLNLNYPLARSQKGFLPSLEVVGFEKILDRLGSHIDYASVLLLDGNRSTTITNMCWRSEVLPTHRSPSRVASY